MSARRISLLFLYLTIGVAVFAAAYADGAAVQGVRLVAPGGEPLEPGTRYVAVDPGGPQLHSTLATREIDFQIVAQIHPFSYGSITFGDSDHDAKTDAFIYVNDTYTYHYRIIEEQGDNIYTDEYSGPELIPYATGDFDDDGKADLVGQYGDRIQVYEAIDANSYPTQLVWTSPALMNVESFINVADTDGDGRDEFLYSYNPLSGLAKFYIFENTGPDAYTQVYMANVAQNENTSRKVVADLDNDGRIEIAMGGLLGYIYVFECTGNNAWSRVYSAYTGLFNAYGCEGGVDTNGNGKREVFLTGCSDPHWCWETQVFEASSNNVFPSVATLDTSDGYLGIGVSALGDLDGTGPAEFISQGNEHFWVWRPNETGGWDLSQTFEDPLGGGHVWLKCYDANQNGRDEVFWITEDEIHSAARTLVLEGPSSAGVPDAVSDWAGGLRVSPNPCRVEAQIALPGNAGSNAMLSVFDSQGRLRSMQSLSAGAAVATLRRGDLEPGVYRLLLTEGNGKARSSGKVVLAD